jgi:hypothetical protein
MVFGAGIDGAADQDRFHLSPEQSLAYLKGDVDEIDTQIVESHVDDCLACAGELQDLAAFEIQTRKQQAREAFRESYADPAKVVKHSLLSPRRWRAVQAAALLLLVALVVATIALQNRVRGLSTRVSDLEAVNDALRQEIASLSGSKDETQQLHRAGENTTNARAEIAVALNDGGRVLTLDSEGVLSGFTALPARYEKLVKGMLTSGEAPILPDVSVLAGKRETMMGTSTGEQFFRLLNPVGVVVFDNRPTFSWTALDGAGAYTVDVFDSDLNRITGSEEIHLTRWTPRQDLEEGRIYIWQVTALKDGREVISPAPPAPQARFKVLGRASVNELKRAKSRYPGSHLLLGGIYAQAGLLEDAEREFKALLSANADSAIARKLLQSVQSVGR